MEGPLCGSRLRVPLKTEGTDGRRWVRGYAQPKTAETDAKGVGRGVGRDVGRGVGRGLGRGVGREGGVGADP
eukprot:3104908-Pyramimonas_sp.AAC.1